MQVVKFTIWYAVICMLFPMAMNAQTAKVKAYGEIEYKGLRGPKKDEERAALEKARQNVIEAYGATLSSNSSDLYQKIKGQLYTRLNELIVAYNIVDEKTDKTSKRYTVYIEASVNTNIIDGEISKAAPAVTNGGEPVMVAYFFAARTALEIKSFEDDIVQNNQTTSNGKTGKRTKANEAEEANVSEDGNAVSNNFQSTELTETKSTQSTQVTQSGSVTRRANEATYKLIPAKDLRAGFNDILLRGNYEGIDPADMELQTEVIEEDFKSGDISTENRKAIFAAAREFEVPMVAWVVMDAGLHQLDDATSLFSVTVTVTAEIRDCSKRLTKTVASILGDTYKGLGDNPERARAQALKLATEKTAAQLVDQLQNRGIK